MAITYQQALDELYAMFGQEFDKEVLASVLQVRSLSEGLRLIFEG